MVTSCIRHPENTRFIQLHAWQVEFCQNNHCAALILSHFIAWHDWKLRNDQYYQHSDDIAGTHGDSHPHSKNAYLFFTTEDLILGCMGLYDKKAITGGLKLLVSLGVISIHKNPNHRYHFDKTTYFQFYPNICNQWLAKHYPLGDENGSKSSQNKEKIINADHENIILCDEAADEYNSSTIEIADVMDLLVDKGFPTDKLKFPDEFNCIKQLIRKGAKTHHFSTAYELIVKATRHKQPGFGIHYLLKVVEDVMTKQAKPQPAFQSEYVYKNNLKNIGSWARDLI